MAGSFNKSIPSLKPSKSSFTALNHSQLNQLGQLNQATAAQAAQNSRLSSLVDLNPAASTLYGQALPPYTKGLTKVHSLVQNCSLVKISVWKETHQEGSNDFKILRNF